MSSRHYSGSRQDPPLIHRYIRKLCAQPPKKSAVLEQTQDNQNKHPHWQMGRREWTDYIGPWQFWNSMGISTTRRPYTGCGRCFSIRPCFTLGKCWSLISLIVSSVSKDTFSLLLSCNHNPSRSFNNGHTLDGILAAWMNFNQSLLFVKFPQIIFYWSGLRRK